MGSNKWNKIALESLSNPAFLVEDLFNLKLKFLVFHQYSLSVILER